MLRNQFLVDPLEVMSLRSCHVLDIECSPPKGNFKNEDDDLDLNSEAGSRVQEDKEIFGVWLFSSLSHNVR